MTLAAGSCLIGLDSLGLAAYEPENDPETTADNGAVTEYLFSVYGAGKEIPVDTSAHYLKE